MRSYYVPYLGKEPAAVSINGHRVILLARKEQALTPHLTLLGAEKLERLQIYSKGDEEQVFEKLSVTTGAGVVITPSNLEVPEVLRSLEQQLPWVQ